MRASVEVFGDSSSIIFDNLVGDLLCFIALDIMKSMKASRGTLGYMVKDLGFRGVYGHSILPTAYFNSVVA